jgi:hypothetical protein
MNFVNNLANDYRKYPSLLEELPHYRLSKKQLALWSLANILAVFVVSGRIAHQSYKKGHRSATTLKVTAITVLFFAYAALLSLGGLIAAKFIFSRRGLQKPLQNMRDSLNVHLGPTPRPPTPSETADALLAAQLQFNS